jgi:hypothetical protein
MRHLLESIVLIGILSGTLAACVPITIDPARDQFGVSTARPDAGGAPPAEPQLAELDRKARAICTTGYQGEAPTVQPADSAPAQQLVHQLLRCGHYDRLTFDYFDVDWSNVF